MNGGPDPLIVAAKACVLVLGLVLFGRACFSIYAPAAHRRPERIATRVGAPVVAGLAAVTWIGLLARELGGAAGVPDADVVVRLCVQTGFGRALSAAVLTCALLAVLGAWASRRRWARLALSALFLTSVAMVGHAAGSVGVSGVLRRGLMAIHLLAAGTWLGGLSPLASALWRDDPAAPALIDTFGRMAFVAVMVVIGTGLVSILYVVIMAGGLLGPAYLRAFLAKLALVAGLLTMGGVNRLWLTPMLRRNVRRAIAGFRLSVLLEQVCALGLVWAVALLGQLDPSM